MLGVVLATGMVCAALDRTAPLSRERATASPVLMRIAGVSGDVAGIPLVGAAFTAVPVTPEIAGMAPMGEGGAPLSQDVGAMAGLGKGVRNVGVTDLVRIPAAAAPPAGGVVSGVVGTFLAVGFGSGWAADRLPVLPWSSA